MWLQSDGHFKVEVRGDYEGASRDGVVSLTAPSVRELETALGKLSKKRPPLNLVVTLRYACNDESWRRSEKKSDEELEAERWHTTILLGVDGRNGELRIQDYPSEDIPSVPRTTRPEAIFPAGSEIIEKIRAADLEVRRAKAKAEAMDEARDELVSEHSHPGWVREHGSESLAIVEAELAEALLKLGAQRVPSPETPAKPTMKITPKASKKPKRGR